MKKNKLIYVAGLGLMLSVGFTSCEDKLDLVNANESTTADFGNTVSDLEQAVIACYNHLRLDGTFSRLGYLEEACGGDEIGEYNSNLWWSRFDWLNSPQAGWDEQTSPLFMWSAAMNASNLVLYKVDQIGLDANSDKYKELKGQALFVRGLALYELATFYQDVPFTTNYEDYGSLEGLYMATRPQSEVLDQAEADFSEAMKLLPSRDNGGEWALGRATCGAAAGYYARTLMFRHKFADALPILKDILSTEDGGNQKYGAYRLMDDYGDNFRSQSGENNDESLFEIQFLDYGVGCSDGEWGPVNNSKSATQGQAIETVFANGDAGGWNDLGAQPWLYQTFKSQKQTNGNPDPRLYWTLLSYEPEYDNMEGFSNMAYTQKIEKHVTTGDYMGITIAKHTAARENIYKTIPAQGLTCGVNVRVLRYSDILLRAAECENEINGPTADAFKWINKVRNRAGLANLDQSKFSTADALFEQIANVERPTEFGCEHGRLQDLIRWGFFYSPDRLAQLKVHGSTYWGREDKVGILPSTLNEADGNSFQYYQEGHEYMAIVDKDLNANYNLKGNSANYNTSNRSFYDGYTIHPVVEGIGVQ